MDSSEIEAQRHHDHLTAQRTECDRLRAALEAAEAEIIELETRLSDLDPNRGWKNDNSTT